MKKIQFVNLERAAAVKRVQMSCSLTADAGSGILPFHAAHAAVGWAWLQWQINPDFGLISSELATIAGQIANDEAAHASAQRYVLGYHEWFLMSCALLSGDLSAMRQVAGKVLGASTSLCGRSHYAGLAGIVKSRILNDHVEELRQFELAQQFKTDRAHPTPSISLLRTFVAKEYGAFERELAKGVKKYWTDSYLGEKVIVTDDPERVVLNVSEKHVYFLWAYPEAVLAKLALMDGATITCNDVWFPIELVRAIRRG